MLRVESGQSGVRKRQKWGQHLLPPSRARYMRERGAFTFSFQCETGWLGEVKRSMVPYIISIDLAI